MTNKPRPKIGLALSGASGRAIAHIAVLEVLRENNIPIDVLVGCSSGALIAASYAAGTLDVLKTWLYNLTVRKMLRFWSTRNAQGAIFHLNSEKAEQQLNELTKGLNFEDIKPLRLGFVAADLHTGELVTMNIGSINQAFKASVAVPGLLEPVVWGRKLLVDGGLVNIVPTLPTKEMGADIVIGVNLAATKFIYEKRMPIWRGYRFLTRLTGLQFIREKILPKLSPRLLFRIDSQSDLLEEEDIKIPGVMSVLSMALDHSFAIEEQWDESQIACDLMLEPKVKHYGKTEFNSLEQIYLEGRRCAQAAIPEILELINNYDPAAVQINPADSKSVKISA
ncbi:MAG TPA: patatin-like phospholipase family protein [Methylomirabilota bacterium]|jgi:NTE family protein|nr:patatin-like phospholipase family protein [Methylomirabilota bacterium]